MAWFKKARKRIATPTDQSSRASRVPEGLMVKCPGCAQILYNKDLTTNLNVCPKCAHHFRLNATERLRMLFDDAWVDTTTFASYANSPTVSRAYAYYPIDPALRN